MTDALDTLRPEVREALNRQDRQEKCDEYCPVCADRKTIRAELLRLAISNGMREAHEIALGSMAKELMQTKTELASLKARIADGWLCGVSNDACPGNFDAAIYCLPSRFRGKRVRLLVEE